MLVLGTLLTIAFENAAIDFIAGVIGAAGLVWLITGRLWIGTTK
jgi:hypothetical protein